MVEVKFVCISEVAAMKRLDRAISKNGKKVYRFKKDSAEAKKFGRFYIVDLHKNEIVETSNELTKWLKREDVIKGFEFIEGEGKFGYQSRNLCDF